MSICSYALRCYDGIWYIHSKYHTHTVTQTHKMIRSWLIWINRTRIQAIIFFFVNFSFSFRPFLLMIMNILLVESRYDKIPFKGLLGTKKLIYRTNRYSCFAKKLPHIQFVQHVIFFSFYQISSILGEMFMYEYRFKKNYVESVPS